MEMSPVLLGAGVAGWIILLFGFYYLLAFAIRRLAKQNLFWTFVEEGTAKAVVRNGRFAMCVMSYSGHMFRQDAGTPSIVQEDNWDIVQFDPKTSKSRRYLPLLKNVRWTGLYPFSEVHNYRFSWTSLEETDSGTVGNLVKNFKYKEENIDYILVQDDIYVTRIETAECADNIPLNLVVLVGGRVVNPYKALFRVERWLEATLNVVGTRMRNFVADRTYAEVRQIASTKAADVDDESSKVLDTFFDTVKKKIEKDWGFHISFVQVYSVDPGSELAAEFIQASTQLYVAQQKAEANKVEGAGLAARDTAHFKAIAGIPGGHDFFKWDSIRQSKLVTYVDGGGAVPAIPVSTQQPTPSAPPAPETETEEKT